MVLVTAAADRLGVQTLSQTDEFGCIPLHYALARCTVVAVVSSVIKGTPLTMLHKKDNYSGKTPLYYLNDRGSSLANTDEITALFQSALSVSVCVMLYAVPTCRQRSCCTVYSHNLPLHTSTNLTATHSLRSTKLN